MPGTLRILCDVLILVDQSADPVVSPDVVDRGWGAAGEGPEGSGLAESAVRPVIVVAAPRGAALYRSRSGQGREEMSRDLMADP